MDVCFDRETSWPDFVSKHDCVCPHCQMGAGVRRGSDTDVRFGFMFRFTSVTDRDVILTGGLWVVNGTALALETWSPLFVPSLERLPCTTLWMRLPNLPFVCWMQSTLELIAAAAGRFVGMDDSTSLLAKGRIARVALEVDTAIPLVPCTNVLLEGLDLPIF